MQSKSSGWMPHTVHVSTHTNQSYLLPFTSIHVQREREGEMGLEDLGDLVLSIILSKAGPKNAAMIACVSRRFRVSASDEGLWLRFCSEELDLSSPEDPYGNPSPSFKVTYKLWKEAFGMYPWPLVRRAKQCWSTLKSWMAANFPEAGNTLRKGASEAEIKVLEDELGVTLPLPTRVLYRFCDGQEIGGPEEFLGLIGGYFFYDHAVNVYLLPLSGVIFETRELRHGGFRSTSKYVVVAASTYMDKLFILNCDDGQLYVGTGNLATNREMIPCVPDALIRSVHDMNSCQLQDAILLWLEEHGRRLQSGTIRLREEGKIRSISLFPETSPLCSIAVTNGVQGCMLDGVYFGCCQLYWRHWVIRANDVVVSTAGGDAVIGKHPLLYPGAEEFVYESCSPMRSSSGSIEGAFTFVPGRLVDPKGRPFNVEVARFPLELPNYIF